MCVYSCDCIHTPQTGLQIRRLLMPWLTVIGWQWDGVCYFDPAALSTVSFCSCVWMTGVGILTSPFSGLLIWGSRSVRVVLGTWQGNRIMVIPLGLAGVLGFEGSFHSDTSFLSLSSVRVLDALTLQFLLFIPCLTWRRRVSSGHIPLSVPITFNVN